jgi:betaine-aldehyde dehydrogenase
MSLFFSILFQDLGKLEARNSGKTFREALWDMDDVVACFNYYADLAEKLDTQQNESVPLPDDRFTAKLQYQPLGVVAAIVPWNYPLLMCAWKIAPALAAGCTMILKPSELTPLTAFELTEIIDKIGLPAGVFNLISGLGVDVGAPLSKHPDIDKVAFTGSVKVLICILSLFFFFFLYLIIHFLFLFIYLFICLCICFFFFGFE